MNIVPFMGSIPLNNEHLKLTFENEQYVVTTSPNSTPQEIELTVRCLKKILGEEKFVRICQRPEINLDLIKIEKQSQAFTQEMIEKIFFGMFDIKEEDLSIKDHQSLGSKFSNLIIIKYFNEFEKIFTKTRISLNHFLIDKAETSGKGWKGLLQRIFLAIHHHFKVLEETTHKAAEIRDAEALTSRFSDRELQKGSVLHLSDGFFVVEETFIGGGAYASLLRDLEDKKPHKLVCRGTALRRNATDWWKTGANDILIEMGSWGAKSVWPGLSKYLIEHQIKRIEVLGKSLGGAHAQELAVLIEGLLPVTVEKLITVGSIGVSQEINELFKEEILSKRAKPFVIEVIRNGGRSKEEIDYVPALGDVHLGEGADRSLCDARVFYIQPGQESVGIYSDEIDWLSLAQMIIKSLGSNHCRQTTLSDFNWIELSEEKAVNHHLSIGQNTINKIRLFIAYFLDLGTLYMLNGRSFNSYFYQQKEWLFQNNVYENALGTG